MLAIGAGIVIATNLALRSVRARARWPILVPDRCANWHEGVRGDPQHADFNGRGRSGRHANFATEAVREYARFLHRNFGLINCRYPIHLHFSDCDRAVGRKSCLGAGGAHHGLCCAVGDNDSGNRNYVRAISFAKQRRNILLHEIFTKRRAIRSLSAEHIWIARHRGLVELISDQTHRAHRFNNTVQNLGELLVSIAGIATLGLGALGVSKGLMTSGALIGTMALVWRVLSPLQSTYFPASAGTGTADLQAN